MAIAAVALPAASSGQSAITKVDSSEFCCAHDQNVAAFFSYEMGLFYVDWGWPEGDPRELAACGVLGGETVAPSGKVDTSGSGFDTPLEPCRRGKGTYYSRFGAPYIQMRFLCSSYYPCGGAQFILSAAVRMVSHGGIPPNPNRCRVPRVVGLRLGAARTRIRRAMCAVGRIRRVRSRRIGRVLTQTPRPGRVLYQGFPIRLVVGRR